MGCGTFRYDTGVDITLAFSLPAGADALVSPFGPDEAAADQRAKLEPLKADCWTDSGHILEEELADRTKGIMVEALPELVHTVPVFQVRGCTEGDRMQPAGGVRLFQNAEGLVHKTVE